MFKFISKLSIAFLLGVATTLPVVQAVATAVNCPNDARIVGYNNFYDLRESLHSGGTRILCPGTTFYVDQEITISSFATLQCGTNGDADDKCIIKGGARQLNIVGEGGQFVGITFQGATSGALRIHTSQSENGRAVFRDCVFEKHGNAANEDALGSVATVYRGGQAVFENCLFRQNVAFKALLDIKDGDVTIIDSIFQESFAIMNSFYDGAGLVYVDGANAHLDLLNSCFIRNIAPALVYVESAQQSSADSFQGLNVVNQDNYGEDNASNLFGCNAIFHPEFQFCEPFEAVACGPTMPSAAPSLSPSSWPSASPSLVPSSSPSQVPSAAPSDGPTGAPSSRPSEIPSASPSALPTESPYPSGLPSFSPTDSMQPSASPSVAPTESPYPSGLPSFRPTNSIEPSVSPSVAPSESTYPSGLPSFGPTDATDPSPIPSVNPSLVPSTHEPSVIPSMSVSPISSLIPPIVASESPSDIPSSMPSSIASDYPSDTPSMIPSFTMQPTEFNASFEVSAAPNKVTQGGMLMTLGAIWLMMV